MNKTEYFYKSIIVVIVTVSGLYLAGITNAGTAPEGHDFTVVAADADYVPGQLLVRFTPKAKGIQRTMEEKLQILTSLGGATIKRNFTIVPGLCLVELPAGQTVEDALKTFNIADGILYAEPNYKIYLASTTPNDTRFDDLWGMHNTGQTGGTEDADIDAPEAWDIATDANDIIVAVIDTGVDYAHPDLAANMWVNEEEFYGDPYVDDDNNGYVDDIYGYDFYNTYGDPMDDNFHGTHCAGTVGAVGNNNEGVVGVCWNVRIMAVKFLDEEGGGWVGDAISSVEYATQMGVNLSSNSWGGYYYSQGLKDAIDAAGDAGMLFVAAAGNYDSNNDWYPFYPASYDSDNIIAVMATDHNDVKWSRSNWGATSVDIAAPGADILSTFPTYMTLAMLYRGFSTDYETISGTSMATPHVAGACALLWSANPWLNHLQVKDVLMNEVDEIDALDGLCVTGGRLNVYKALACLNATSRFYIKNSSGVPVAWFDDLGNLVLEGILDSNTTPDANDDIDEFRFEGSDANDVAIIDANDGNMYITGFLFEEQNTLTPSGDNNFIIKDSNDVVVAYIDDPNGDLYLKGRLYENSNP